MSQLHSSKAKLSSFIGRSISDSTNSSNARSSSSSTSISSDSERSKLVEPLTRKRSLFSLWNQANEAVDAYSDHYNESIVFESLFLQKEPVATPQTRGFPQEIEFPITSINLYHITEEPLSLAKRIRRKRSYTTLDPDAWDNSAAEALKKSLHHIRKTSQKQHLINCQNRALEDGILEVSVQLSRLLVDKT